MNIDWTSIVDGTAKVLVAGLLFGAGLPLLFTLGMRLWDTGSVDEGADEAVSADGTVSAGTSDARGGAVARHLALWAAYAIFAIVIAAVVVGVLYITHKSIDHYLGIELF